jgi:hypothetical protein
MLVEVLDLSENSELTGTFPYESISRLQGLRKLSAEDVIHIFHITFLQPASSVYSPGTLSLSDIARLKVAPLPSSINQLTALEYLSIARSYPGDSPEIEPLPSEIGDLSNLGKILGFILLEMFPQAPDHLLSVSCSGSELTPVDNTGNHTNGNRQAK